MPPKRADAGSRTPDPSLTKRVLWPSELRRRDPRIVQRPARRKLPEGLPAPVAIDEVQRVPARSEPSSCRWLGRSRQVRPPDGFASLHRTAVPPLYSGGQHSEIRMNTGETERWAVTRNEGVRGSSPRVGFTKSPQTEHFQRSSAFGGRQRFPQRFPQGASRGRRGVWTGADGPRPRTDEPTAGGAICHHLGRRQEPVRAWLARRASLRACGA
jgi:hypothetical protein